MARVMFEQAKLDLERSSIEAPYDGWVLDKSIEVGQHVNIGQQMGSIYKAGELDIEVNIPTKEFKWLPPEMGNDSPVAANVVFRNTGDEQVWKGHVARVKARMDQRTRTLPVVVEVDEGTDAAVSEGGMRLRPGMFVTIKIKGKAIDQAFVLPRHVVYPGDVVYTLANDRLKMKDVGILRTYKDSVIINEGISEGDQIIKTPLSGAVDGMKVRLKE
jgi:RND family efflux transporter MFP subunit